MFITDMLTMRSRIPALFLMNLCDSMNISVMFQDSTNS